MITSRMNLSGTIGGVALSGVIEESSEGIIGQLPPLPAAKAGTLGTRTSDTAGTLTLSTGHGIQTGDIIDIYWSGGQCRNATVGTVAGNSVPFTTATGDVLPAASTSITASKQTVITQPFNGDLVLLIFATCSKAATLSFWAGSSEELALELRANRPWAWCADFGTNPLSGHNITTMRASQSDSALAHDMNIGAQLDSVA